MLVVFVAAVAAYTHQRDQKKRESKREKQAWIAQERGKINGLRSAKLALHAHPDAAKLIDAEISKYESVLEAHLQGMNDLGL